MPRQREFVRGYQTALMDVMSAMVRAYGTADVALAALQWVADNATGDTRANALTMTIELRTDEDA